MAESYIRARTLDDLMRLVFEEISSNGVQTLPNRGKTLELAGVLLELQDPRARLSRTETRGKPLSCLGELCWYLSKRNDLSFIEYYIPDYADDADDGVIYGGYGPRLFNWNEIDQFRNVEEKLRSNRDSRRAVIQIFDRQDIDKEHSDVPCTCTLQFMVRREKLNLITHMRSNDAYKGLPHDIFCFTMLQEIMARKLSMDVGTYKHMVGSLHLYDEDARKAERFLGEGWQTTTAPMPPMPSGDPTRDISQVLMAECAIRTGKNFDMGSLKEMKPYWADLIRLLLVLKYRREKNLFGLQQIRETMESDTFAIYIH